MCVLCDGVFLSKVGAEFNLKSSDASVCLCSIVDAQELILYYLNV